MTYEIKNANGLRDRLHTSTVVMIEFKSNEPGRTGMITKSDEAMRTAVRYGFAQHRAPSL